MKEIELIGGPLDGAHAEDDDRLVEGQNVFVHDDNGVGIIYTVHDGCLEFNSRLTFGR